jgi:transposase InsO family protein
MNPSSLFTLPKATNDVIRKRELLRGFAAREVSGKAFSEAMGVSRASIYRYQRLASGDVAALVDGRRTMKRKRTAVLDVHIHWIKCFVANFPRVPLSVACEELNLVADRENWPRVKYSSLLKVFNALPSDERSVLRDEDNDFFQKNFPVGRRVTASPLQLVQLDSTEIDIWCIDMETSEVFRPWMTAAIDTATRVVLGVHVHRREPNSVDVLRLTKEAMLPKSNPVRPWFGVWESANTDNGGIFIDGGVSSTMVQLGVDWYHSPKGCSGANGKIERLFGTFITRLFKKLPGYSGRPSALFRAKAQGAIPFPLMQGIIDRFIDTDYHVRVHSELGMSPWEAWNEQVGNVKNLVFNVADTADAFRFPIEVEIHRGSFVINGQSFKSPLLSRLDGVKVKALCNPEGLTRKIEVVFAGKTVCWALRDDGDLSLSLNAERTKRVIELRQMRRDAKANLQNVPPTTTVWTATQAEVKADIEAAKKPKRKGRIKPVKFEVEAEEDKLP